MPGVTCHHGAIKKIKYLTKINLTTVVFWGMKFMEALLNIMHTSFSALWASSVCSELIAFFETFPYVLVLTAYKVQTVLVECEVSW